MSGYYVSGGQVRSGVVLDDDGRMVIWSGGTASDTTINDGRMDIWSGGTASVTTIGDGDDVIWANKGDNLLFGDAGNDRIVGASGNDVIAGGIGNDSMHGGGGNDVFAFCDNWGTDTVQQLETGTVMLWFVSGDKSNWNASTLTYTDGDNSVKVSGVTAEQVTLKFGDDESDRHVALSGMGAFDAFASQQIFEESGKGILATLA